VPVAMLLPGGPTWWRPRCTSLPPPAATWPGALELSAFRAEFNTNLISDRVLLNEVMADNVSVSNADGTVTDWVELHNATAQPVGLAAGA